MFTQVASDPSIKFLKTRECELNRMNEHSMECNQIVLPGADVGNDSELAELI